MSRMPAKRCRIVHTLSPRPCQARAKQSAQAGLVVNLLVNPENEAGIRNNEKAPDPGKSWQCHPLGLTLPVDTNTKLLGVLRQVFLADLNFFTIDRSRIRVILKLSYTTGV